MKFYYLILALLLLYPFNELVCQADLWQSIGPQGAGYNSRIIFDSTSQNLYVIGNGSLYKKEKDSDEWVNIVPEFGETYASDLVIRESSPNELYYFTDNNIYKSENTGQTWELYYSDTERRIKYLNPRHPEVFVALKPFGSGLLFFQKIQKSTDAGKTWFDITGNIDLDIGPLYVYVNHYNPQIMYARQMKSWGGDVISGNFYYKSTDDGISWSNIDLIESGYNNDFVFDPLNSDVVYCLQYNAPILKTTDGGAGWQTIGTELPAKNNFSFLISPFKEGVLYYACTNQLPSQSSYIYESTDGGTDWSVWDSLSPSQKITSMIIKPGNNDEILAVNYPYGVFQRNAEGTWTDISKGIAQSEICSFSVFNENIIYAGKGNSGLFKTTNGGINWTNIYKSPSSCPGKIWVSPVNPDIIYTNEYMNGINFSKSEDGGRNWIARHCNINFPLVFDVSSDEQTIYAGVITGQSSDLLISSIAKSSDGGQQWEILQTGIDNINYIDKIKINPADRRIVYCIAEFRG